MSILFIGDIAYPKNIKQKVQLPETNAVVANLEGPIINAEAKRFSVKDNCKYNLFSQENVVALLNHINCQYVSLANNHVLDFNNGFENTLKLLQKNDIIYFGDVQNPYTLLNHNGMDCYIIGTISELTGPKTNQLHHFNPAKVLSLIAKLKTINSKAKIFVYIHWGYELSHYPQPADRTWARLAILSGADAVIGHHPHVVQGVEKYRNGIIAYSLGNFYLPQTKYIDKTLKYNDPRTHDELCVEINPGLPDDTILHWIHYEVVKDRLTSYKSETLCDSQKIKGLTPFSGLSDREYIKWFKEKTKRKKGTPKNYPTFYTYSNRLSCFSKISYIKFLKAVRGFLIRANLYNPFSQ